MYTISCINEILAVSLLYSHWTARLLAAIFFSLPTVHFILFDYSEHYARITQLRYVVVYSYVDAKPSVLG